MRQKARLLPLLGLLALLFPVLNGCGRMQAANEVKPDGSLTRTLIFHDSTPEEGAPAKNTNPMGGFPGMGGKLTDTMILPTGPDWKVTRVKKESETTITYTRTVPPGGTLTDDIGIRKDLPQPDTSGFDVNEEPKPAPKPAAKPAAKPAPKPAPKPKKKPGASAFNGSDFLARSIETPTICAQPPASDTKKPGADTPPVPLLSNTVTVREIEPGKLEYREVIRWRGTPPTDLTNPDEDMMASLKKALPPALAQDTNAVKAVTLSFQKGMWTMLFGPGDPILSLLLINPDLAEYKLKARLTGSLDRSLIEHFGDRLSAADRAAVVAKLSDEATGDLSGKTSGTGGPPTPPGVKNKNSMDEMGMPIALFLRVKMPGKILSTNGQVDPDTGEVLWNMYSYAPAMGEVTLTAVCQKP